MVKLRGVTTTRERSGLLALALVTLLMLVMMSGKGENVAGAGTSASAAAMPSADTLSKISAEVFQDTANGKSASFFVLMSDQANLSAAYGMKDQDARGWYVYNTLTQLADRTQADIRATLRSAGVQYRVFWIANALFVTGDRALVESLAARVDVRRIEANHPFQGIDPIREASSPVIPNAPEWGVQNVKAPEVWAMGYRGQGIVVGNQDTGMRWTHEAIKPKYRGWDGATADHNYNWWDAIHSADPLNACGSSSPEPCDDDELLGGGHGTHTTGSAVGGDSVNQIGVAPDAKWIGCRNMERGVGVPVTYLECFEFFLAPWDQNEENPDPTKRPHVMNNSWGCVEGCPPELIRPAVEASSAAGIFVEASAGNDGPTCSTVAFAPAMFEASFATGAIDINNTLAEFSSRGPVVSDGSMRLKPNLSAPGVDVRSSLRGSDNEYGNLSGTSMAGPHTVGVVALIWSARPDLVRNITETKTLLQGSANPDVIVDTQQTPDCGGTPPEAIPNNYFGWGRIDAFAALNSAEATVTPGATVTPQPTFTVGTPMPTRTPSTPLPSATPRPPTNTAVAATATSCTISFSDVPSDHTFYSFVRCLACRGIISGYSDGTFKPGNDITRGQIAKMVSNSAGFDEDPGPQIYEDVDPDNPFYAWINRLSMRGHMGGYDCGLVLQEPCVPPSNRPYFRPYSSSTRGQLAKITSNAAGIGGTPTGLYYTDVAEENPFYIWIMRLTELGTISGYPCGGEGEPCDDQDRPYFRPFANVTRGQASKIVAFTFYPNCLTPSRR
ncbi:MAG TPA: S8 family serine peptidase [Chloroflexia bacterium]|nr:S8 family serine peptidase [Chloroflexia bacterium]